MEQRIYVDAGNSMTKAAVRVDGEWRLNWREPTERMDSFFEWLDRQEGSVLVCSVDERFTREVDRLASDSDGRIRRPVARDLPSDRLDYKTPETLGMDRYYSCLGACRNAPGDVVVLDAGTACTVDFMSGDGVFRGGVILPGLDLILRSFAESFPELGEPSVELPGEWPGRSTRSSVAWGTAGLFGGAIRRYLEQYEETFGSYNLYLTGGESGLVAPLLEAERKPRVRPWLLFDGMEWADREFGLRRDV